MFDGLRDDTYLRAKGVDIWNMRRVNVIKTKKKKSKKQGRKCVYKGEHTGEEDGDDEEEKEVTKFLPLIIVILNNERSSAFSFFVLPVISLRFAIALRIYNFERTTKNLDRPITSVVVRSSSALSLFFV